MCTAHPSLRVIGLETRHNHLQRDLNSNVFCHCSHGLEGARHQVSILLHASGAACVTVVLSVMQCYYVQGGLMSSLIQSKFLPLPYYSIT